jgi:hypothetical protein
VFVVWTAAKRSSPLPLHRSFSRPAGPAPAAPRTLSPCGWLFYFSCYPAAGWVLLPVNRRFPLPLPPLLSSDVTSEQLS